VSNVHYAYEWGLDAVLLERAIDDMGDIATGMAFMRGAGTQYNKPWGMDLSTWRTSANSSTTYDQATGRQTGGFSAGYLKRHLYIAYMSGANLIHMEPTVLRYPDNSLNPTGTVQQNFANFAAAHPTRGQAVAPIALMLDYYHGFVPNTGSTVNSVWYLRLGYSGVTGCWEFL
jgi:hypothetical protein